MKRKKIAAGIAAVLAAILTACSGGGTDIEDNILDGDGMAACPIDIAYQYGMAYAPFIIMKEMRLIEKNYSGSYTLLVEWHQMNSGAAINEGIVGGSLQFGAMGVGPFVSGIAAGMPYKMFSNFSAQRQGLVTNDPDINSLADFKEGDQIALVNIGSIQHILLAMAAKAELGDAHALDGNILAMSHPDGKTALETGSVKGHLTSAPYIYMEGENPDLHTVTDLSDVWPQGTSFIVGVASTEFAENNIAEYDAVIRAMKEAMDMLANDKETCAEILCQAEGVTKEQMLEWLNDEYCVYSMESKGVLNTAKFMYEEGFIEKEITSFSELAFDNVEGN
ncbi:MAG: ABC transporter substrate-binding protein [Parasporobacterium sp.]|nr:ABC transporter substrate-binding protein [Parasporobacterium sp.]